MPHSIEVELLLPRSTFLEEHVSEVCSEQQFNTTGTRHFLLRFVLCATVPRHCAPPFTVVADRLAAQCDKHRCCV